MIQSYQLTMSQLRFHSPESHLRRSHISIERQTSPISRKCFFPNVSFISAPQGPLKLKGVGLHTHTHRHAPSLRSGPNRPSNEPPRKGWADSALATPCRNQGDPSHEVDHAIVDPAHLQKPVPHVLGVVGAGELEGGPEPRVHLAAQALAAG